jgi:hypothetical protein
MVDLANGASADDLWVHDEFSQSTNAGSDV